MIRFNVVGLIMGLLAGVFYGVAIWLGMEERLGVYVAGGAFILMDLAYRLRSEGEGGSRWIASANGGFLGITPVWITGILIIGLGAAGWLD